MRKTYVLTTFLIVVVGWCTDAQTEKQPRVSHGPGEPDWEVVLRDRYGLSMFKDLKNPVETTVLATPGLFRKAGPSPVKFTPVIALGLTTRNRGGWYVAGGRSCFSQEGRPLVLRVQELGRRPADRQEPTASPGSRFGDRV